MNTIIEAIQDRSDLDSLALYRLKNIVRLAAFAAEARRTLEGINDAIHHQPEMQARISGFVTASQQWAHMSDTLAEALTDVANQIEVLAEEIPARAYKLAESLQEVKQ